MKKLFLIITLSLFYLNSFGKIEILCDVIYEKTEGEWSDYYRVKVEFLSGQELELPTSSNKLFAVIWFSQTNCAIIEMDYNSTMLNKVNKNLMFTYLTFDVLNEGKMGTQVNGQKSVKWRIYGKDENALLIDPMFSQYPYNSYNKKVSDNAEKGVFTKRIKPKS